MCTLIRIIETSEGVIFIQVKEDDFLHLKSPLGTFLGNFNQKT